MRLPSPVGLAALALIPGVLPTATAAAADRPAAPSAASQSATSAVPVSSTRHAAEQALAAVTAALGGPRDETPRDTGPRDPRREASSATGDLTLALRDLRLRLEDLSAADQVLARQYLARPTGTGDGAVTYSANADVTNDCETQPTRRSHFCIHWARRSSDAPPPSDTDQDGVPDTVPQQVRATRKVLNSVWDRIVTQGGYKAPLKDAKGPNAKFDVYLYDLGRQGIYGYCAPETRQAGGTAYSGYCVLDNDFARFQFPLHSPQQNLEVTAAHEFFHAVQFAYDAGEDSWLMESTAAWMEDEIYDDVNDNLQYLSASSLRHPGQPLDSAAGLTRYGNWVWWRYLTELRFPGAVGGLPRLVQEVWERADGSGRPVTHRFPAGRYSVQALAAALRARRTSLPAELAGFGIANRRPRHDYAEGRTYPRAAAPTTRWLRPGAPRASGSLRLQHLSNGTVDFRPDRRVRNRTLTVHVSVPPPRRGSVVEVTRVGRTGPQPARAVRLSSIGTGTVSVGRFGGATRRVELTFTNGGSRYACHLQTNWSCQGRSLDNGLTFAYHATARR